MGEEQTPRTGATSVTGTDGSSSGKAGEQGTEGRMAGFSSALVDAVEAALGPWIRAAVEHRHPGPLPARVEAQIEAAAERAVADIGPRLRDLLALDVDDQWTNPLAIIRDAVAYPTDILAGTGVEPVERDATARRLQPDDLYDLTPGAFGDLGPEVHEPGLMWGAAKAHIHLARRRRRSGTAGTATSSGER